MRDRPAGIKEFEFVRGELFFQPMLTFSLAVTGYHAIIRPDSLAPRRVDSISYTLGGLIIGGLVCGSVLKALEIAKAVMQVADDIGCTPSQVAISWVRQQPGIVVPLIGARTLSQLQDNLGSLDVTLNPEQLQRLDEVSRVDLGFPHNFLDQEHIRDFVYGGTYDSIRKDRPGL